MSLYLVRHDETVLTGLCYGQTDCHSRVAYTVTAERLRSQLPEQPAFVASSPLVRCSALALALYPEANIHHDSALQEIAFGDWEGEAWDNIDPTALNRWAESPTHFQFPGGEALRDFQRRIATVRQRLLHKPKPAVVISHAGVIRLWLSLHHRQSWASWLGRSIPYASVHALN